MVRVAEVDGLERRVPGRRDPPAGRPRGSRFPPVAAVLLVLILVYPAGAMVSMTPVTGIRPVGDAIVLSGMNTDNSTTFLFLAGPYLDENGVRLTNTSRPVFGDVPDLVTVNANMTWYFEWNTSLPEVNIGAGNYIVYASAAPLSKRNLMPGRYVQQTLYFQESLTPRPTSTTAAPTPVPTWTPPPAGVEVMASSGPSDDYPGRFDGDLIVYEARRGDRDSDIYLYNISSGETTAVATGPAIQKSPSIFGGKVVYSSYEQHQFNRSDADVFLYETGTGATTRLTLPGDQVNPRISGNLLAWQDEPPGRSSVNIMLYDLITEVKQKVPARTWAYTPDISGGKVIWIDDPVAPAVYFYDINGGTVRRVTNKSGIKGTPVIDGNRITWADTRSDNAEVYVLDLGTLAETQVTRDDSNHFTPAISGDRVAWVDFRNGNRDIYLYDLAARRETAITTAEKEQVGPQIGGCTVAWADERNGSYDLYYRKIPGCTPPPAPASVTLQPAVTTEPSPASTPPTTVPPPTTPDTTVATTPTTPSPVPTTTKPPGFGALPAFIAASLAVLVLRAGRER
jgi:beta propeller repeat protein